MSTDREPVVLPEGYMLPEGFAPGAGPVTCGVCGRGGFWSVGPGSSYEHDTATCAPAMADDIVRLRKALRQVTDETFAAKGYTGDPDCKRHIEAAFDIARAALGGQ